MEQTHYVGTCPHDIPAEWYNTDDSTYYVLDTASGAYVIVTTCEDCKTANEQAGSIVEEVDIPMDNFIVDTTPPASITVFNNDGSSETFSFDETNELTDDEINSALDTDS